MTSNKVEAQKFHDKLRAELWSITKLDNKPIYTWRDAVIRWLKESNQKRSIETDKIHLRWLDKHLCSYCLHEITRDVLESVALQKKVEGVSCTTVNRVLEVVRAILRKANKDWDWIDKVPVVPMHQTERARIRWLTVEEVNCLLKELPSHLKDMAIFALATGLRESNVTNLQWCDIDMAKCHAWIHPDQAKTKRAIPVPLNNNAMAVLKAKIGDHPQFVFTYQGQLLTRCNNHAWRKALNRAGIENFRWHDLRHTWASWHVQNGTSLQELQQLGGWSSFEMVLRYAHLSSDHLRHAANRIGAINLVSCA